MRVEEISREGVDQEILFPQRMLGVIRNEDFDYIQACMDAYNELLAEFCASEFPEQAARSGAAELLGSRAHRG